MEPVNIRISRSATCRNINRLMTANGYKAHDLQEACGFEQPQAVYKWLNGQSLPSIDCLLVLARIFRSSLDDILAVEEEPLPLQEKAFRIMSH